MTAGCTVVSSAPPNRKTFAAARPSTGSIAPWRARSRVIEMNGDASSAPDGDMQLVVAVVCDPRAQSYGPPAKIAAPRTVFENATWNCTAMNAPDDNPETEVSARSIANDGT